MVHFNCRGSLTLMRKVYYTLLQLNDNLITLQQKAKERTVKTQNIEYDLETLVKKIDKGIIKLDPEYQRRHRWTDETSSKLIESLILNIPIPLIYLSQDVDVDEESDEESRYSVIDGQQRLNAIVRFFKNRYKLQGLDSLNELDGFTYANLPPFLIRRLEERTVKCLRIDSTLDNQIKYDIFERLNTGSIKLEPQELRNAVSRGPFNDLIKRLSQNPNFRSMIRVNETSPDTNNRVKKMADVELVLRFFALDDGNYLNAKPEFKQFLDEEMIKMNSLDGAKLALLEKKFNVVMETIHNSFGENAFAKYKFDQPGYDLDLLTDIIDEFDPIEEYVLVNEPEGTNPRRVSPFNVAVYDALTVGVSMYIDINNPKLPPNSVESFIDLFKDLEFQNSIASSINGKVKLNYRIEQARAIFHK